MVLARYERPLQDAFGNLKAGQAVQIRVRRENTGTLARLYSDRDGSTPMANPFTVTDGKIAFHVVGGAYRITPIGYEADELRYVGIGTAQEQDANTFNAQGWQYQLESETASPPTVGCVRFSSADLSAVTEIYISKETLNGAPADDIVLGLAPGGKSVKNRVLFADAGNGVVVSYQVDGATDVDEDDYIMLEVSDHSGGASYSGASIFLQREISGIDGLDDAAVIPSAQRFAVGGAAQSVDLGIEDLHPLSIRVFIDGVYQFTNTFDLTDGVLTPVGGTWPGDGVTENMEVIVDATSAIAFSVPSNGSVTREKIAAGAVGEDQLDPDLVFDGGGMSTETPFGRAGMRVLVGLENDAHYGFNSTIFRITDDHWVIAYRRASNHTVTNGAEIVVADTFDQGATLENKRTVFTDASYDTRNFVGRVMANGRLGIIASRRAAGTLVYTDPVFIYSDDDGETWSSSVVTANSAGQPINFHGSMIDFPASAGGDDADGFIAYSYGGTGTGNVDALATVDNGATWSWTMDAAISAGTSTEIACSRVGGQDKWIMLGRPSGTIGDPGEAWVSDDPLDFGASTSAGVELVGNPPQTLYDDETGLFWYITFARRDRGWGRTTSATGIENVLLMAAADGDDLYAAGGDMSALSLDWSIVAHLPDWASGYIHPFKIDGKWYGTFVCGEDGTDHNYSKLCLIGDFIPTEADRLNFERMFSWFALGNKAIYRSAVEVGFGVTPPSETGSVTVNVESAKAGLVSEVFSTNNRTHYKVRNPNGVIGSISGNGSATAFNTSSDGNLKTNRRPLAEEIDVDAVIGGLSPQAYDWLDQRGKPTGERGHGLIAQDLHEVYPAAVSVGHGKPGDADYVPWSIDYSKLVILLLAKIQLLDAAIKGGK